MLRMKPNFRVVIIFIFLLFEICAVVEVGSRHISRHVGHNAPKDSLSIKSGSSIDCFSPDTTTDQLKAVADEQRSSCSENMDRKFWESACSCAVNNLPESQCPKCRVSRNVEVGLLSTTNDFGTTFSPVDGIKLKPTTVEDNESMSKKLRLAPNNSSTVSNSANFIRFGK